MSTTGVPSDIPEDLRDAVFAPGFVDMQINGIADVDFSRCTVGDVDRARKILLEHGVTAFLPTLVTAPMDTYRRALDVLAEAGVDGVHLEGPFLGGAPGAHRHDLLRTADVAWMASLLDDYPGLIRYVTVAPEADPGLELFRLLAARDVVASVGHTTATYDEVLAAAAAGATAVTHLFNAQSGLHHREPGVVGAALEDDRLTPSLIADLVHVHPAAIRVAVARKRNIALVSDAIAIDAAWASSRGIREVGGAPRLQDGTLAGSILTMDRAVRNVVGLGVGIDRAIEMASVVPAELLGLDERDDVVALDRSTLEVRAVWLRGERVA